MLFDFAVNDLSYLVAVDSNSKWLKSLVISLRSTITTMLIDGFCHIFNSWATRDHYNR
ncbi:unnamed protein product [Hymenolepis diminuta]|uniref:Uncharacterized protein n=1 Tax=Hymenolepis diminuta TaxID=6216 RepID=A0A564YW76_HYMDI|nr:unnamed protein product [Hymenolepis diminuta]